MAWISNGPVSLPPQTVVYVVAGLVGLTAVTGAGLGFHAAWRENGRPTDVLGQSSVVDDAVQARPIVELPAALQPTAAPAANAAADTADEADSNDIAAKTAEAQEIQARPSKSPMVTPDDILASPTERPPPPSKPSQDETAPPNTSDVPF